MTFDLETRLSPDETGWGAARAGKAGVSILVAHDGAREHLFDDSDLTGFVSIVEQPGTTVCGYNVIEFDLPVVEALVGRRLALPRVIDLYDLIKRALEREHRRHNRCWKLGMVAKRTMGLEKTGNGEFAPQLLREGRIADLVNYCRHDVTLTRALLDYVRRHGGVLDDSGDLLELDIPPWLRLPPRGEPNEANPDA